MAANELAAHCSLQPPAVVKEAQHICTLLGGFMPRSGASAGEQVLSHIHLPLDRLVPNTPDQIPGAQLTPALGNVLLPSC